MALPSLTKTWQFNANNAQGALGSASLNNRTLFVALKNAMKGFGTNPWTVVYSCDSVTAGTAGDGVDRIVTAANVVASTAGARSWIVLKQTGIGSNYQLLITFDVTNGNTAFADITYSPSAGYTGGTTTTNPTATDQSTNMTPSQAWSGISTDVACRWTVMQSTDGQCTRWLVFAAGTQRVFAMFEKGANPTTGTPGATNSGWATYTNQIGSTLAGQTIQNAIQTTTVVSYETAAANIGIASEVSGVWDIFPFGATSSATVGARGRLFTIQDAWLTSPNLAVGDSFPATGTTNQFIVCGGSAALFTVVLPWNAGAINLS